MIKIAYIVITHQDPKILARLADALHYGDDKLYVHVDANVGITPFINACNKSNVIFVKRNPCYWAGYSIITATMNAIKEALETDSYDRFVLFHHATYPLYSPLQIHRFFEEHNDEEFCHVRYDCSISKDKKEYMKICGYHVFDYSRNNQILRAIHYLFSGINRFGIKYRNCYYYHNDEQWHIYCGWAHWALSRKCVEFVYDFYCNNSKFNSFMKHVYAPDELYFHTIIHNSRFKHKVASYEVLPRNMIGKMQNINLTYFEYPNQVALFTEPDEINELKDTKALFIRKVHSEKSKILLDTIDRENESHIQLYEEVEM